MRFGIVIKSELLLLFAHLSLSLTPSKIGCMIKRVASVCGVVFPIDIIELKKYECYELEFRQIIAPRGV